jgi:hypothetical protein
MCVNDYKPVFAKAADEGSALPQECEKLSSGATATDQTVSTSKQFVFRASATMRDKRGNRMTREWFV